MSDPQRLMLTLSDKINLKRSDKYVTLSNLSIYYARKNIKKTYRNKIFKISSPVWNHKFELPDGSYSVFDIQDYFEYIIRKHKMLIDNPPIRISINKIENRITIKIKTGYYLELLTPETMKLLGSTRNKKTKDKIDENAPYLKITKVVLSHYNILNSDYQHDFRVFYTFVLNKFCNKLLDISPTGFIFLKTLNSDISYIEVWFADQNSKPPEVEKNNKYNCSY